MYSLEEAVRPWFSSLWMRVSSFSSPKNCLVWHKIQVSFILLFCYSSVTQSCPSIWNPMDCSTPGFPVLHCLLEFTQTHIHWVYDAIQPSQPLSPPSPLALNLSQHQGLFQWVGSLYQVAKVLVSASTSVLPMNIQGWFPLRLPGLISVQSKGLLRVFSSTTVRKHQFFDPQPCLWSNSHIHIWLLEKP